MSSPKWVVSIRGMGEGYLRSEPGAARQTTWSSRQPTAQLALEEGAAVLGVAESRLQVTSWGEIDWSDSGDIQEMDAHGNFK